MKAPLPLLAAGTALVVLAGAPAAQAGHDHHHEDGHRDAQRALAGLRGPALAPRTHFTMAPDGSSGARPDGEGIPNIDSVKATIRRYYGADANGIANPTTSPYITEMNRLLAAQERRLPALLAQAKRTGKKPAIVFDADDTTLMTYDMEDNAMHFAFDPALQDVWVQGQKFPATPGMVAFQKKAQAMGFTVFGLTGRGDDQKAATLANLAKVGYTGFTADRFFTKWTGKGTSVQPPYITCAAAKCTTVEYKAGTRKHIESLGYTIAMNLGDQWSDLQGGHARAVVKLPNPTYYLPSPNLPGVREPRLAPRTRFTMAPDGSSGARPDGEGIPNIDSVKATVRTYYGADATGIASKTASPYLTEMTRRTRALTPLVARGCSVANRAGLRPAIVLDADDTTLMTYDMEDAAMKFNFTPAAQEPWVQEQRFPATPGMVALVNAANRAGCTVVGLTGRSAAQKDATIANLAKVGYQGFTPANYYTKWATGQQPSYISCAAAKCTTVEYKSQTRAHVESPEGGAHLVLASFGDQFSDLLGGHALVPVKLPNPTYYLP